MVPFGRRISILVVFTIAGLQLHDVYGCYKRIAHHGQFPLLYIDDCTSNYDLGLLIGGTFSSMIQGRLRNSIAFQKVQAFCSTAWGRQLLLNLQVQHRLAFPAYYLELQGLAAGAQLPFDQVFMLNLRQEILSVIGGLSESQLRELQTASWGDSRLEGDVTAHAAGSDKNRNVQGGESEAAAEDDKAGGGGGDGGDSGGGSGSGGGGGRGGSAVPSRRRQMEGLTGDHEVQGGSGPYGGGPWVDPASVDACSDLAVRLGGADWSARVLVGHNEDMTNDTLGRMYYLRAAMPGHPTWFALTYAGELASTAFGANTAGVAFTLNALYPLAVQLPGLGRNFLSRRLLDAGSPGEAVEVLTREDQATGRSVNLMSTRPPLAVWNVEVGPGGSHDVMPLYDNEWYFHANSYLRLDVPQKVDNSSLHRQARAAQFPAPSSTTDILNLLGDTADPDFPIYRTGDYGGLVYTLCTALYDLTARTLSVYEGNPAAPGSLSSVLSLDTLLPLRMYDTSYDGDGGEGEGQQRRSRVDGGRAEERGEEGERRGGADRGAEGSDGEGGLRASGGGVMRGGGELKGTAVWRRR